MPTCLHCNEYIDVEDLDNPIEWESHNCPGVERQTKAALERIREARE